MEEKKGFKLSDVAKDMDLQGWMWSWGICGLGIGAYFADEIRRFIFLILLIGVAIHIRSMYKVYIKR